MTDLAPHPDRIAAVLREFDLTCRITSPSLPDSPLIADTVARVTVHDPNGGVHAVDLCGISAHGLWCLLVAGVGTVNRAHEMAPVRNDATGDGS